MWHCANNTLQHTTTTHCNTENLSYVILHCAHMQGSLYWMMCICIIAVMSHIWMSRVTSRNRHIYECVMSHMQGSLYWMVCICIVAVMSHIWMSRVTCINRSIWMNHVTYINRHIWMRHVVSHVWMCHVTYAGVVVLDHMDLYHCSHGTHMIEPCHIFKMDRVTCMNVSCHICRGRCTGSYGSVSLP